jgi:CheY-like chemotaxis protein
MNNQILIADDDVRLLDYYHSLFSKEAGDALDFFGPFGGVSGDAEPEEDMGFSIRTFRDGAPLVEFFRAEFEKGNRIPLCILDMRMKTMDGLKIAESLRIIDPDIFILIVTAYSDISPGDLITHLKHDVYYVRKPFRDEELLVQVTSLVKSWNCRQRLKAEITECKGADPSS